MHNVSQVGRVPGSTSQSTNYCPLTVSPLFLSFFLFVIGSMAYVKVLFRAGIKVIAVKNDG